MALSGAGGGGPGRGLKGGLKGALEEPSRAERSGGGLCFGFLSSVKFLQVLSAFHPGALHAALCMLRQNGVERQ